LVSNEAPSALSVGLHRTVAGAALVLGVVLIIQLVQIWSVRVPFPYDIEWMEGGMLGHAWRLNQGLSLYPEPSPEFVPYLYPPGYAGLLAFFGYFFGLSAPLGRVLSLIGSLAAVCAIPRHLGRRSWLEGFLGGVLFLACYRNSGAFYDLVRTDGVAMGLSAWAIVWGLQENRRFRDASALLLVVGFLTKQHIALFGLPLLLGIWARFGWRDAVRFGVLSVVPALASVFALQTATQGLFLKYVVGVAAAHPIAYERVFLESPWEWGTAVPAIVVALVALIRFRGTLSPEQFTIIGCGAVACFSSAMMRGHYGGFINVQIPAFWAFSWWVAHGLAQVSGGWKTAGLGLVAANLVMSLTLLKPETLKPTDAEIAQGDRIVEALRKVDGPVLSPMAAWLPVQAGHPPSIHLIAVWDIDHHKKTPFPKLGKQFRKAVAERKWGAVLDGKKTMKYGVDEAYPQEKRLRAPDFKTRNGWRVAPVVLRTPGDAKPKGEKK